MSCFRGHLCGVALEKSVADFSKQISDLKARTTEELSDTDDGSADFSEYRDTVISGYNDLEELLSNVTVENYETVMADISALINPEKPYVSLADDLPFNDVSDDNITYSTSQQCFNIIPFCERRS
ncbi:hypothetical protein [Ruminococcus albus]|nr:hypothetical protein [Ruminococcus albus]